MKRNLLFYLYPVRGTTWKWHVDRLLEFQAAWNGRRIVIVALGPFTDPQGEVNDRLAPLKAEILWRSNDADLGESRWFTEGLGKLESRDPDEATFYAHAKGVTRDGKILQHVISWSQAMYVLNCSLPEAIERKLKVFPTVGAFRQKVDVLGVAWNFSGTFFWLRHDAIFERDWKKLEIGRWGVEAYPGKHFAFEESYNLTPDNITSGDLYFSPSVTQDASVAAWKRQFVENSL